MRICIVNHYAYAPDQGAGNRHYEFARELLASGHHVVIVSCSFYHKERRDRHDWALWRYQRFEIIEGVPYLWLRSKPYDANGARRWINVIGFARNVLRSTRWLKAWGPDVIVGSSPDPLAAWAGSEVARRLAIPFVYEVRDVWPDLLAGLGSIRENDMPYRALRWLDGRLSRKAQRVISVWPGALNRLSAGGRTRVEWIPNGSRFPQNPPDNAHRDDVFRIIYAGAHGPANDLVTVLKAARILEQQSLHPSVRFDLIGDGPEKARLIDRARGWRLSSVRFHDPVPREQISDVLTTADAFLMPLVASDAFKFGISPNKLFDYAAAGRPIVFAVTGHLGVFGDGKAGPVAPSSDPGSLAQAIADLVATPAEEVEAMGRVAFERGRQHHDLWELAQRFLSVCEATVEAARAEVPESRLDDVGSDRRLPGRERHG